MNVEWGGTLQYVLGTLSAMSDDNTDAARDLIEGLWAGHLSEADDHPAYWPSLHTFGLVRDAFPDLAVTIKRQFVDGDTVTTDFELSGTHTGALLGAEPTGRHLAWSVVYVDTFADGKVVVHASGDGWLDMLINIGALPPPG